MPHPTRQVMWQPAKQRQSKRVRKGHNAPSQSQTHAPLRWLDNWTRQLSTSSEVVGHIFQHYIISSKVVLPRLYYLLMKWYFWGEVPLLATSYFQGGRLLLVMASFVTTISAKRYSVNKYHVYPILATDTLS